MGVDTGLVEDSGRPPILVDVHTHGIVLVGDEEDEPHSEFRSLRVRLNEILCVPRGLVPQKPDVRAATELLGTRLLFGTFMDLLTTVLGNYS